MKEYRVIKNYRDKETGVFHKAGPGEIVRLTDKRADEITDEFLTLIEAEQPDDCAGAKSVKKVVKKKTEKSE